MSALPLLLIPDPLSRSPTFQIRVVELERTVDGQVKIVVQQVVPGAGVAVKFHRLACFLDGFVEVDRELVRHFGIGRPMMQLERTR